MCVLSARSDTGGVGSPGIWCQLLEPARSQHELLEPVGVLSLQPLGWELCVSQKSATVGTRVSEVSEGVSTGGWSGTAGHSLCA